MYDEPFAGLDPISLNVIAHLVRRPFTGRTPGHIFEARRERELRRQAEPEPGTKQ